MDEINKFLNKQKRTEKENDKTLSVLLLWQSYSVFQIFIQISLMR